MTIKKGYKLTEETKRKMSESAKLSINSGRFTSERLKGNKFRVGISPWSKGLKGYHTIYPKNRKSQIVSQETRNKIGLANKGRKMSEELKIKQSIRNKGKVSNMKGKHHSEETKNLISDKIKEQFKNGRKTWCNGLNNRIDRRIMAKDKHYNWQGGISFEPYSIQFNSEFKELIRQRDNLSCIKCNLFQEDSKKLYNRKLHVHHIDYNKLNTTKENCCALCVRCNCEVNFNRVHWTKFFQSLLNEKYGYNYIKMEEIKL